MSRQNRTPVINRNDWCFVNIDDLKTKLFTRNKYRKTFFVKTMSRRSRTPVIIRNRKS